LKGEGELGGIGIVGNKRIMTGNGELHSARDPVRGIKKKAGHGRTSLQLTEYQRLRNRISSWEGVAVEVLKYSERGLIYN